MVTFFDSEFSCRVKHRIEWRVMLVIISSCSLWLLLCPTAKAKVCDTILELIENGSRGEGLVDPVGEVANAKAMCKRTFWLKLKSTRKCLERVLTMRSSLVTFLLESFCVVFVCCL